MGTRIGEDDDCSELTVEDVHFIIHKRILRHPKSGLHFKVKNVDFSDDSVVIECVETMLEYNVKMTLLKAWNVL